MKKIVLVSLVLVVVAAIAACAPVTGQYVHPPANANWQDVPVATDTAFGLDLNGTHIVQYYGTDAIAIQVPGISIIALRPNALGGIEVTQGVIKGEVLFKNFPQGGDLAAEVSIGDRKFIFRKNPTDPSRWQVYAP